MSDEVGSHVDYGEEQFEARLSKLPQWAQRHINALKAEIARRDALVKAHGLLCDPARERMVIYAKNLEAKP